MKTRRPRIVYQSKIDIALFIKMINLEEDMKKQEIVRGDNYEIYALVSPNSAREIPKETYDFFEETGMPTGWVLYSGKRCEVKKEIKEKFGHRLLNLNK